jgi:vacuolar-type H+-ATPase subunit C/Vma6
MQFALNNTFSLAIKKAPNKALYKFIINNIINLLNAKITKKTTKILNYKI